MLDDDPAVSTSVQRKTKTHGGVEWVSRLVGDLEVVEPGRCRGTVIDAYSRVDEVYLTLGKIAKLPPEIGPNFLRAQERGFPTSAEEHRIWRI